MKSPTEEISTAAELLKALKALESPARRVSDIMHRLERPKAPILDECLFDLWQAANNARDAIAAVEDHLHQDF